MSQIVPLNGGSFCVLTSRYAETVKDDPRGVGTIERIKMDSGYVVIQKIMTLFQSEVNTDSPDAFRVIFAPL